MNNKDCLTDCLNYAGAMEDSDYFEAALKTAKAEITELEAEVADYQDFVQRMRTAQLWEGDRLHAYDKMVATTPKHYFRGTTFSLDHIKADAIEKIANKWLLDENTEQGARQLLWEAQQLRSKQDE
jgi:hypothetical protein